MFGSTTNGFRKEHFPRRWREYPSIQWWVRGLVGIAAAGWAFSPALAEINLIEENGTSVNFGLEAAAGYFHTANTNFGTGRVDPRGGESTGDARWSEGYLKPSLNAAYGFDRAGKLYGGIRGGGQRVRAHRLRRQAPFDPTENFRENLPVGRVGQRAILTDLSNLRNEVNRKPYSFFRSVT